MHNVASRALHIDGLRSLAIIPVVLFHAGWTALPGGFVGVDIFFVISGYLITRILDTEMTAGDFSLWRFYERRARRIMPALFVVLAVSSVIAFLILMPADLVLYGRSLLHALLSISNVYFYLNTGYFDAAADNYALLHTWSLAVEEQFYLVFPLLLLALVKLVGSHRRWAIAVLAIASFALSVATSTGDPSFAFYLPFTRAWELMAGSLLALNFAPTIISRRWREAISATGLVAILATIFLLTETVPFPGWIAAIPVLGAAALIQYAPGTWTGRLLSLRPLVGIGLISYSLYLWHWPLLVFADELQLVPLALWQSTAVALLAVFLSILTWKYVEQPFRDRTFLSRSVVLSGTFGGMAFGSVICLAIISWDGLPQRLPAEVSRLAAFAQDISPKRAKCHDGSRARDVPPQKACSFGANVPPTIAVWGDSHGVELSYALGELAAESGKSVLQLTSSACGPALDVAVPSRPQCSDRNRQVVDYLVGNPTVDTVIVVSSRSNMSPEYLERVFRGLEKAVVELKGAGKTIVLDYPTPRARVRVPRHLAMQQWRNGVLDPTISSLEDFEDRLSDSIGRLDALAAKYDLVTIRPTEAYCPDRSCVMYRDGVALFFDQHHPSLSGARLIVPLFADVIAQSGKR